MIWTRREFLRQSSVGLAGAALFPQLAAAAPQARIRISARHFGDDFATAQRAGMDGLELGVGGAAEKLRIADTAYRQKIKADAQASGLAVSSLSMDLLNGHPLFSAPQAPGWVAQTIAAAGDLGAVGILVPFFGAANLLQGQAFKPDALDALVGRLKELAPPAGKAGVSLGLESTLSARMYLELLDRVGSSAVGAYYDIGNCTNAGLDVPADLRALKGRLSMIHFKDGSRYLGEGAVKMPPICAALRAIGYDGWIVLETACPSKNAEADCRRNADYSRKLLGTGSVS
ncbi:MAG: sugar phosphate isomerase/epimerase [Kiritimatiellaeota bacterium]|nr:sugar phosphate isomerase/epimerase [Kiritimatiellota bacterium]